MKIHLLIVYLICLSTLPDVCIGQERQAVKVSRGEILEAMKQCQGYDPTATTNGARFQAEVILRLARQAKVRDPNGPPLFIDYADWYHSFLEVTGRTEATAPQFARLAYQHRQDLQIDYRAGYVIEKVEQGPEPELALNVRIWWEKQPRGPDKYSYSDTLSTPNLNVTNHHDITYRLLEFKDWILYDRIEGLTGRPTTGVLGFLFRLIGEGSVVENRMAISSDGLQISRARAKKMFIGVTTTVTVTPDGKTTKDIPAGRPDLAALETLLKQSIDIDYK